METKPKPHPPAGELRDTVQLCCLFPWRGTGGVAAAEELNLPQRLVVAVAPLLDAGCLLPRTHMFNIARSHSYRGCNTAHAPRSQPHRGSQLIHSALRCDPATSGAVYPFADRCLLGSNWQTLSPRKITKTFVFYWVVSL